MNTVFHESRVIFQTEIKLYFTKEFIQKYRCVIPVLKIEKIDKIKVEISSKFCDK